MPTFLLSLLLPFAHADSVRAEPTPARPLTLEVRGPQVCALGLRDADVCYADLSADLAGVDLIAQLTKYDGSVDDQDKPRADVASALEDVPAMAAGLGLSREHRRDALAKFDKLNLTVLAADVDHAKETTTEGGDQRTDVSFLAQIVSREKGEAAPERTTYVAGRLSIPESGVESPGGEETGAQFNRVLSGLIEIERVSEGGLSAGQIRDVVAPAVVSNAYAKILVPMIKNAVEAIGDALGKAFGSDPTSTTSPSTPRT